MIKALFKKTNISKTPPFQDGSFDVLVLKWGQELMEGGLTLCRFPCCPTWQAWTQNVKQDTTYVHVVGS
jgi:hypothetical protein